MFILILHDITFLKGAIFCSQLLQMEGYQCGYMKRWFRAKFWGKIWGFSFLVGNWPGIEIFNFFLLILFIYTKMHQKNVGREKFEKKVLYCPPLLRSGQLIVRLNQGKGTKGKHQCFIEEHWCWDIHCSYGCQEMQTHITRIDTDQ